MPVFYQCGKRFTGDVFRQPHSFGGFAMPVAYHLLFLGVVVLTLETFRVILASSSRTFVSHYP